MKVLIGGGTGFIGGALTQLLRRKGHEVEHISRSAGVGITWDDLRERGLPDCDAVVNVAGQNVLNPLRRWNAQFKEEVTSSRISTTKALRTAIANAQKPPRVWLVVSGIGYYRPSLSEEYDEDSAGGDSDFFSRLVRDWERAAWLPPDVAPVVRQVVVRSGVVLGKDGGAMKLMVWPFWLGLGGAVGSGQQAMPWIHVDDLSGILAYALENERVLGVLNGVAPAQNTNGEFARALAQSLSRPSVLPPVPSFVLQTLLGAERAVLLLEGQKVIPRRTLQTGYRYLYPELQAALKSIVS